MVVERLIGRVKALPWPGTYFWAQGVRGRGMEGQGSTGDLFGGVTECQCDDLDLVLSQYAE